MGTHRSLLARVGLLGVLAVVMATAAPPLDAKTDIKVTYDKQQSFKAFRTWTWHPEGPGDVKLAVSSEDDPKRVAARVDPVIVPSVEREMTARGFARALERSDLYVHYYVLATVNFSAQQAGQFLPPVPEWGIPPFTPHTTALEIYPTGTLIIDVMTAPGREIVWRGAAERRIDLERPDSERRQVLERAVHDLIAKLPRK